MKNPENLIVAVIDDDEDMREAMIATLESVNIQVASFESADQFLKDSSKTNFPCAVMDIRMPGLSGIEALRKMNKLQFTTRVIFVTGHADVEMAVEAMKCGAVDFLTKPFRDQALIDAVQAVLQQPTKPTDFSHTASPEKLQAIQYYQSLTAREKEVLTLVSRGLRSKQIASEMCLALKTVEEYRSRLLEKMHVRSSTELVALTMAMELTSSN